MNVEKSSKLWINPLVYVRLPVLMWNESQDAKTIENTCSTLVKFHWNKTFGENCSFTCRPYMLNSSTQHLCIWMPAYSQMGAIASWLLECNWLRCKRPSIQPSISLSVCLLNAYCIHVWFYSSKSHYTAVRVAAEAAKNRVNEFWGKSYSKIPSCSFHVHLYALHVWLLSILSSS